MAVVIISKIRSTCLDRNDSHEHRTFIVYFAAAAAAATPLTWRRTPYTHFYAQIRFDQKTHFIQMMSPSAKLIDVINLRVDLFFPNWIVMCELTFAWRSIWSMSMKAYGWMPILRPSILVPHKLWSIPRKAFFAPVPVDPSAENFTRARNDPESGIAGGAM